MDTGSITKISLQGVGEETTSQGAWLSVSMKLMLKASGVGREGGFEALRFFTEAKNVCIKY